MKKIILLLLHLIRNYIFRSLFKSIKNKKEYLFIIKTTGLFFLLDLLIIIPLIVKCFSINILIIIGILFLSKIILSLYIYFFNKNNLEKMNNEILNGNLYKTDFMKYISNDIYFNLNCGCIVIFSLFLYQISLYFISIFFLKINIDYYFILLLIYFIFNLIVINLVLFINFFTNRKYKGILFKFEEYKEFKSRRFILNIVYFIIFYIVLFFVLKGIIGNFVISLFSAIPFSVLFSILLNSLLLRLNIYSKIKIQKPLISLRIIIKDIYVDIKSKNLKNLLKYIKYLLVIPFFIFIFVALFLLKMKVDYSTNLLLFQALIFTTFSFMFFPSKKNHNRKIVENAMNFTVFLYAIIFSLSFLGIREIALNGIKEQTNILYFFVTPLIETINTIYFFINVFLMKNSIIVYILIPIVFIMIYFILKIIIRGIIKLSFIVDNMLKKSLNRKNSNIIFGDSCSFFYFLISLIVNLIIILLLKIESKAISAFFVYLFDTFQVSQVFSIKILTEENINLFFMIIIYIAIFIILVKLFFQFLSSLLSHFILFNDEVVYLENKVLFNTVLRIPLSKINYVICRQNIIEKFFDIGTIFIETQDKNGLIKIDGVSSIKEKSVLIMEKIKIDLQKT